MWLFQFSFHLLFLHCTINCFDPSPGLLLGSIHWFAGCFFFSQLFHFASSPCCFAVCDLAWRWYDLLLLSSFRSCIISKLVSHFSNDLCCWACVVFQCLHVIESFNVQRQWWDVRLFLQDPNRCTFVSSCNYSKTLILERLQWCEEAFQWGIAVFSLAPCHAPESKCGSDDSRVKKSCFCKGDSPC